MTDNFNSPNQQPVGNFDPNTGMPVGQPQGGYNPYMGASTDQPQGGYNPYMGASTDQPQGGYNPNMGAPTGYPQGGYNPNMGGTTPPSTPKKSNKGLIIGIIVGAIVLVVILAVVLVSTGVFYSKERKVYNAFEKTFEDKGQFGEDTDFSSIVESGEYTATLELEVEDEYIDVQVAVDEECNQIVVEGDAEDIMNGKLILEMTSEDIAIQAPSESDEYYVYNFQEEASDDMENYMSQDDLEMMNSLLRMAAPNSKKDKFQDKLSKNIKKELLDNVEVEKINKKDFEVDKKTRSCTGYKVTVTEEDFINLSNCVFETYQDVYGEDEQIEELMDQIEDIETTGGELEFKVYLYKNQLAAICTEIEGMEMELLFKGGDYRMQNMELLVDGESIASVEGYKDGNIQGAEIYLAEVKVMSMEYDSKTGEFSVKGKEGILEFELEGVVTSSKKEVVIEIDKIEIEDQKIGSAKLSIKKGAEFTEISGKEQDIVEIIEEIDDLEDSFDDMDVDSFLDEF